MKKFFSFLAAAAMLFTASCSNDESGADGDAFVSFALNLDGVTSTKADPVIGKGTKVNTLMYSIYELKKDQDGKVISTNYLSTVPAKTVTFPATEVIRLAKNKDYKVVFWAQSSECGAYSVDPETMEVSVSYDGYNNDENRDAFFKAIEVPHVTGSVEVDVEMKRPFAQLNVGVISEDWEAAVISHAKVLNSQVTISEVANKINLLTGEVEAAAQPQSITFRMAQIPTEMLMVDTNADNEKEPFYYLSMSYLLVNDQNTEDGSGPANVAVDFVFETESNQITLNVPTVSVQRNYRTNILGQILTGNVTFDVYIDAEFDGNHNIDITPKEDIVLKNDYAEVYNIEGLMKWCYIVNNEEGKLGYGMKLMENIILPAKTIELDAANKTYKFTTTDITVTDGVPSGSNWVPVGTIVSDFTQTFTGHIDGQNFKIQGLRIVQNADYTGFIGAMFDDASIRNLILDDAVIKGNSATAVVGRAQNGTVIENVHVTNSSVTGTGYVGGIVGYNYRRKGGAQGQGYQELMSYVKNCTTDKNTMVVGSSSNVGGICGTNYGAVIINCVNNADVTGNSYVGGVVGYTRDYHHNADCYVIACGSTAEATITATDKRVGGVAGHAMSDNGHSNTAGYIVACYSQSSVSGKTSAVILGSSSNSTVIASVGVKNGTTKACDGTVNSVFAYANAGEVTQSDVDAMNQAIATYNATAGIEQTCPYTWEWTNGSLPVLK